MQLNVSKPDTGNALYRYTEFIIQSSRLLYSLQLPALLETGARSFLSLNNVRRIYKAVFFTVTSEKKKQNMNITNQVRNVMVLNFTVHVL